MAPTLPVWLMAGLRYLKHAHDLSDEEVCQRCGVCESELNERARKVLKLLTPVEVFQRDILQSALSVALQS